MKKSIKIAIGFLNLIFIDSNAQGLSLGFNVNQTAGCSPLTIQFTNTSMNASSYYWDFGNGTFSTLTNPSTIYTTPGTYSIKLIAMSANGHIDSTIATNWITVFPNSISDFHTTNTISCITGNSFSFINTSLNSVNCFWEFGDGSTTTIQNPTHSYVSPGNYTIKLTSYNSFDCVDTKIIDDYIHVVEKPVAAFTVNDTSASERKQVFNFNSTTSNVNSWFWKFGNGDISIVENPKYIYNDIGTYTVSLIVRNENGCTDTLIKPNYISINVSLLLKGEILNNKVLLNWTKYDGWDEEVDYYTVEKLNEKGEWEIVKTVDGKQLVYEPE